MKAYQLKIMIKNSHPPIWRRVIVPAGLTFSQLEVILNEVMGWCGYHLGSFIFNKLDVVIEEPEDIEAVDPADTMFEEDGLYGEKILNATQEIIDDFLEQTEWFSYIYDFGDYWDHRVTVEKLVEDYPYPYAQVIKFKGETPFEDCGGIAGYVELLRILEDPGDPEYEDALAWTREHFTVRPYPIEDVNEQLAMAYLSEEESGPMGKADLYEAFWEGKPFKRITAATPSPGFAGKAFGREQEPWESETPEKEMLQPDAPREQWAELYEVASRIKELAPWEHFDDVDLIGANCGDEGTPVFFNILGGAGHTYGIVIYEGQENLQSYMLMQLQEELNLSSQFVMANQNVLTCYWGNREELTTKQRRRIKELGYQYRGKNQWLYFLSFVPGYWPCDPDGSEVPRMISSLKVLEMALQEYQEHPCERDPNAADFLFFEKGKGPRLPYLERRSFPAGDLEIKRSLIGDELLLAKIAKAPKKNTILEAEIAFTGAKVQESEDKRPLNPTLSILIDAGSGMVLSCEMGMWGEEAKLALVGPLIGYILTNGAPREIHVSNPFVIGALDHACRTAGIKLVEKRRLPHTDEFLEGMHQMIKKNNAEMMSVYHKHFDSTMHYPLF